MKDVLVKVDKFYIPMDFVILDTQPMVNQGTQFPVILGKPFLALPMPSYTIGED